MSTGVKDILLVGFGAVGAIYSLILERSGAARVTAVARSNYSSVEKNGMTIKSKKYGELQSWKPHRIVNSVSAAADRSYTHVVITTKAVPELVKTSELLEPLLSASYLQQYPQPVFVLFQNGLNVEVDLYEYLLKMGTRKPRIISSALWIGSNLLTSDIVQHNDFDRVSLGVYRHQDFTVTSNDPEESAVLSNFGKILEAGGSTVTIVPEIMRVKYAKNLWNVGFSSVAALTRYTLPAIFRPPPADSSVSYTPYVSPTTAALITDYTIPMLYAILRELLVLARALGFPDSEDGILSSVIEDTIANTRELHISPTSEHTPSMLLDAKLGKPMEVEVILGEVVRMARKRDVDMPRVEMLYALLLVMQNQILRNLGK